MSKHSIADHFARTTGLHYEALYDSFRKALNSRDSEIIKIIKQTLKTTPLSESQFLQQITDKIKEF